ncbi:hypothetical protein V5799_033886 [Amblyomma americanum]|uniref:Uncharacterized protein n=1 Tax=Amblyomma americanum TaxID=6943 RepID=A0AAQ4DM13_AMBAM
MHEDNEEGENYSARSAIDAAGLPNRLLQNAGRVGHTEIASFSTVRRHVDTLRALCTARASALFRRGSPSVLGSLWRLSGRELQQLGDSVAEVSPLRQVLWRDLAPLYAQSRLHELLLDRLLLTHDDLRALLGAVEPRILTRLRVDKIRCMCQDTTTEAGWNLGPDERCIQQRQQDIECLARLLGRAKSLKWLRTDFPVDVDRMAACGPYPSLEHVGLVWIASPASALHRNSLTVRELRVLLVQMPALRELCCDVSQAIGALDSDAEAMAARLEAAQVTHESPAPATPLAPFTPALQLLATLCPNLREVVIRAGRPRDLVPLGRLRHLERLYISYGGTGMHHFLDESLFEALGDAAANLRHLELPTETYIRPQVFVVRPAWKPVVNESERFLSCSRTSNVTRAIKTNRRNPSHCQAGLVHSTSYGATFVAP